MQDLFNARIRRALSLNAKTTQTWEPWKPVTYDIRDPAWADTLKQHRRPGYLARLFGSWLPYALISAFVMAFLTVWGILAWL